MDFGRPMIKTQGIVAKSNIRLVDETHLGTDPISRQVCQAANFAAKDLFLGNDHPSVPPTPKDNEEEMADPNWYTDQCQQNKIDDKLQLINCSLYNEQHLPPARRLIEPGDLVVVFESFNDLNFVYAKPNDIFSNRNGHFHHNDFIGKPYGCKIRSKNNDGLGFLYLLRPTPELWARSLPHRTQIVHELDASMIVHYLNLCPNMIVCESGTGSGAMSHAILRSIAPKGKLHTYEFNKMRVEKARKEFEGHGLKDLADVHHRDVCGKKTLLKKDNDSKLAEESDTATDVIDINGEDDGKGGFQLGQAVAHAIFLDLPEPWLAVPHAAHTIKPNGRVCSYSPCMEQTQRTVAALKAHGFHSCKTVEARLKEYYVDEGVMEAPPTDLPIILTEEAASLEKERCTSGGLLSKKDVSKMQAAMIQGGKLQYKKEDEMTSGVGNNKRKRNNKLLCARPFAQMRGHTAFLTFATAGNK